MVLSRAAKVATHSTNLQSRAESKKSKENNTGMRERSTTSTRLAYYDGTKPGYVLFRQRAKKVMTASQMCVRDERWLPDGDDQFTVEPGKFPGICACNLPSS